MFQSTPPHGGRRDIKSNELDFYIVSIHAPAWGATSYETRYFSMTEVSIHAPAWGATSIQKVGQFIKRVSIHAPAWGATCVFWRQRQAFRVSIHAPAWGATPGGDATRRTVQGFNPRPRMGGDSRASTRPRASFPFQSTPPHGGRHCFTLPYLQI